MDQDKPAPSPRTRRIPIIGTVGAGDLVTMQDDLGFIEISEDEVEEVQQERIRARAAANADGRLPPAAGALLVAKSNSAA